MKFIEKLVNMKVSIYSTFALEQPQVLTGHTIIT